MTEHLKRIYHEPGNPGSLGGVERLYRRALREGVAGITRQAVKEFLSSEQAYTLHKAARRHYPRNHTYVAGIDAQWQADLADMQALARQNGGMRYLLTVIDVFSKYAWVAPVKSKDATSVTAAFRQVLNEAAPRIPRRLQTDKGKEFFNSSFSALLRREEIEHFASESDQKAAVAERFNRTIKTRIWTYLSDRGTVRWVDVVQDIVQAYNNSYHRTIRMAPAEVRVQDQDKLWALMYGDGNTYLKKSIPRGAMVRISKHKGVFDKGYMPNWSKEHFTISERPTHPRGTRRVVYKIADYNGETIKGLWYPEVY
jgi:transposase InsO family protein